jgi:hypothetical protein
MNYDRELFFKKCKILQLLSEENGKLLKTPGTT